MKLTIDDECEEGRKEEKEKETGQFREQNRFLLFFHY